MNLILCNANDNIHRSIYECFSLRCTFFVVVVAVVVFFYSYLSIPIFFFSVRATGSSKDKKKSTLNRTIFTIRFVSVMGIKSIDKN